DRAHAGRTSRRQRELHARAAGLGGGGRVGRAAMKVLFVTYGGGHVEMCLPVMRALRALVPGFEARILALTTPAGVARRAGEQPLGYLELCGQAAALRWGAALLGDQQHPAGTRDE